MVHGTSLLAVDAAARRGIGRLGVRVLWADVPEFEPPAAGVAPAECFDGLLSAGEITRADGYRRPADRGRFVAGRALLRLAAGDVLDRPPADVGIAAHCPLCGSTGHGRLSVPSTPSVQLSSTRGGGRVAVAVARSPHPIGIDLEPDCAAGFAGFDDVALTPSERARVLALPPSQRAVARTRAWVQKEAVLKARGTGLSVDPAGTDPADSPYVVTDIDVGPGYRCSLATTTRPSVTVIDATRRLAALAVPVPTARP